MGKDNIVKFPGTTMFGIEPDEVLNGALDASLESAVVLGYGKDGGLYFATSIGDEAQILLLLEKSKRVLLDMVEDD